MPMRAHVASGALVGALALAGLACEEAVEDDPAEDLVPDDEDEDA